MSAEADLRLTRRAFLGIIAAAGATACTGAVTVERTTSQSDRAARPSPSGRDGNQPAPSQAPTAAEPGTTGYEPFPGETYPNAKRVAGRFAEALLTYEGARRPRDLLRGVLRATDHTFDVAAVERRTERLFVPGATSVGTVVYPQLGGLSVGSGTDRASVMVVIKQDISGGDAVAGTVTRTMDVRLIRRGDIWRVEDLADAGGSPDRAVKALPEVANRVLEDTRIELPDSARWDIMGGIIDERLLATMLDLAGVAPYSVTCLKSGHPHNVFATDKVSGHTLGRGMDIWQIAGTPVVLQGEDTDSEAHEFTEAALNEFDVPELGSPWDLDGPPEPGKVKPSFTDAVHADHIHVAFKAE